MLKRLVTGAFLLVGVIGTLLTGEPYAVLLLALLCLVFGAMEWRYLLAPSVGVFRKVSYAFLTIAVASILFVQLKHDPLFILVQSLILFAISLLDLYRMPRKTLGQSWLPLGYLIGVGLLGGFVSSALWLLQEPQGRILLLAALCIIWLSDIGAYFVGRQWGRHKLAPHISPGKSWEGVIGAMGLPLLVCCLLFKGFAWNGAGLSFASWLGVIVLLVPIGIVGDLFESCYKRANGLKDSGTLLPGHGGLLDRLDSLLLTLPIFVGIFAWIR